ncbi:MAG: hypothetical protein IPJ12_00700 [Betaproteobacteria bacterium]|nr:hypothetical protein [Betaproteobacteria bacterium]
MANDLDFDLTKDLAGIPSTASLLSSNEQMLAGIRVTRAQFARMMGCSRQAVTEWVNAGRLTVGADGRFDPCKAVADLLRTGDPARLRAKVLQPLVAELAGYRARITDIEAALGKSMMESQALRADLANAKENAEFEAGAASEFLELFDALIDQLPATWHALSDMPENAGAEIIIGWLHKALQVGAGQAGDITALLKEGEGEGEDE